jgi:cysteine desulfurase
LRSGTENLRAAAGFAAALELAAAKRSDESRRLTKLREDFEAALLAKIPDASLNGSAKYRAPHLVSLTIEGADNERLMFELDERGIECAVGSACSAGSDELSHVLKAIGLSDGQARATLRFSLGEGTSESMLKKAAAELVGLTVDNR